MKAASTALVLAAAALGAGCTTTYSRLDGERYFKTPLDTYPVMVTHVDGVSAPLRAPVLVEPGRHQVTVQAFPSRVQRYGEQRTIALDVAPCTRYWLVAVKPSPLASDFTVKVDHEEAMPGCTAPKS